jgi:hypothetical protein
VAATSIAVAATLAGCAATASAAGPTPTGGLAVVVGARSNTPPPALAGAAADARDAAIERQSNLAVVVADGRPFVAQHGRLAVSGKNEVARDQEKENNRQLVGSAITGARARTPETDLLAALGLGARAIHSSSGPHTVVVEDSGLSTAGVAGRGPAGARPVAEGGPRAARPLG